MERSVEEGIVDTLAEGVYRTDRSGRFVMVNDAFARTFGYDRTELLGRPLNALVPDDSAPEVTGLLASVLEGRAGKADLLAVHHDGHRFPVECSLVPWNQDNKTIGVTGILRDLTERKQVEKELTQCRQRLQALAEERSQETAQAIAQMNVQMAERTEAESKARELSRRLIEEQEKERRTIGQELHDQVGGSLTAMRLALGRLEDALGADAPVLLRDLKEILDETATLVSTLSHSMRPAILDDLGLLEALVWYTDRYTRQTGIKIILQHEGLSDRRFPSIIETTAYRVVQEALTNVAKYSGVRQASVIVYYRNETLEVCIEDHGHGFDPTQVSPESSGLSGMQDRAFLAGGEIEVDSSPGEGTRITCRLPVWLGEHPAS